METASSWLHMFSIHSAAAHACDHQSNSLEDCTNPAIFVFGDSLSDAGNAVLSGNVMATRTTQWPYGMTFPGWLALLFFLSIHSAAAHARDSVNLGMNISTYPAIFVFGDSLSDAGNSVLSGSASATRTTQWPYGMTFPGWPARRYSNGHTLVDNLATHFGLPFLSPYLNSSADFRGGVNYAVAAATANSASFLNSLGVSTVTNDTLDVQISWHLGLRASTESSKRGLPGSRPTKTTFNEGLYVLHIGGDDYSHSLSSGYPPSFLISTLMPLVIRQIRTAVENLLQSGAKHFLLVPVSPLGCLAANLAISDGKKDAYGCLEGSNLASYLHSVYVKEEVENLRWTYPNASFLFMDHYAAYFYVIDHKEMFGYTETLNVCCGDSSYPYNFNTTNYCNMESQIVCADPSKYIAWDGCHFTDSFTFQIFNQTFITGTYLDVGLLSRPYLNSPHIEEPKL